MCALHSSPFHAPLQNCPQASGSLVICIIIVLPLDSNSMPCPTDEMMLEFILGQLQKNSPDIATKIRDLKSTFLAEQGVTRAATSFERIQEVADAFKLQWTSILIAGDSDPFSWKIEEEAMKKPRFKTSERIQFLSKK